MMGLVCAAAYIIGTRGGGNSDVHSVYNSVQPIKSCEQTTSVTLNAFIYSLSLLLIALKMQLLLFFAPYLFVCVCEK